MNAVHHTNISLKKSASTSEKDFDFFYKLHDFFDCSKEVESTNLHRIFFHNMWAVKRIIIPIFGHTHKCANGRSVNIKDDCESSHILADFKGKFIPNLKDYVSLLADDEGDKELFKEFHEQNKDFLSQNSQVETLLLSPAKITGDIKSLWITHNTWFIGEIMPQIFPFLDASLRGLGFDIFGKSSYSPSVMFGRMRYEPWLHGDGLPESQKNKKNNENNNRKIERSKGAGGRNDSEEGRPPTRSQESYD